jgi:transcriptional regulator with XRE-family HTH domain
MFFGDKLKEILEEKNISQKEFASALNIAPTTLSGYINNKRQPDFELVKKIAFFLNVSIDFLLDYHNEELVLDAHELSIIEALRQMDKNQKDIIYDLVTLTVNKSNNLKKSPIDT